MSALPQQHTSFASVIPTPRVAIQGVRGAFHEIAARQFFGEATIPVPALSFPILFAQAADAAQTDAAILAIENSIAGSILGNYKLLQDSDLAIIGEVYLRIQQNLLALPGVSIPELREVHSHPMALAQCDVYFRQFPRIRLVESEDTAESAARIARKHLKHTGAIASTLAAELYGLSVLAPAIETVPENYTRFLAVRRRTEAVAITNANKASVCFTTAHEPGSLANVLSLLANEGANLTKIQSVPLLGRPWEYQFFVDFTVSDIAGAAAKLQDVIAKIVRQTGNCQILGIYQEGTINR